MKLRLRAAAVRDLDGIFDYSLDVYGAAAADAYSRAIYAAMERLLDYPETGAVGDLRPRLRSLGVQGHRIFYRIEGDKVVIVRVLLKAMDVTRHV